MNAGVAALCECSHTMIVRQNLCELFKVCWVSIIWKTIIKKGVILFEKCVLQVHVPVNNGVWILLFRDKLRNADQKLIGTERVPETRWKVHVLCIIYLLCVFVWCGMWKSESYLRRQLGRTLRILLFVELRGQRVTWQMSWYMVEPGSKKIL